MMILVQEIKIYASAVGGHAIRNMNLQAVCRLLLPTRDHLLAFTRIDRKNSDSIDETSSVSSTMQTLLHRQETRKTNHVALKSVGALIDDNNNYDQH